MSWPLFELGLIRAFASVLDGRALCRACAVSLPLFALYGITGEANWLLVSIATISVAVAVERVAIAPLGALAQGGAIIAGFLLLSYALAWGAGFVVACALLAAGAVALTGLGARLRTLGNFVFIPALYLSCEAAASHRPALSLVPYLTVAILPSVVLAGVDICRAAPIGERRHALLRWHLAAGCAAPRGDLQQAMLAVALAVISAATLVEWRHLEYGQWAIWSSASVVTGDATSAPLKLRDRGLGALLGVPLGLALGIALPPGLPLYLLANLASVLSLVAFRRYVTGFAARCACIVCAAWAVQPSAVVATHRVVEVLLGGVIGLASVFFVRALASR